MTPKFHVCKHCGNVIEKVSDSGVPVVCCGEPVKELIANTVDASREKHVPVVTQVNECTLKVEVGSAPHPMLPEHHIAFIYIETENGGQLIHLADNAEAFFCNCQSKPVVVYAYCNLHGLWKVEM